MKSTEHEFLRDLREDHARFCRVLSMIGRDARRLVDEPDAVMPLFEEAIDYVVNFQNVHHHPREEEMFAMIAEVSPSLAAPAKRLTDKHRASHRTGKQLLELLENVSNESDDRAARIKLARGLESFAKNMRDHINQEEELLYAHAWRELSASNWEELERTAPPPDPLGLSQGGRYPHLASYVSEGQAHSTVSLQNSPLAEFLSSRFKPLVRMAGRLQNVQTLAMRQQWEAFTLSRKYFSEIGWFPLLKPINSLDIGMKSARQFGEAHRRWLREWRELLDTGGDTANAKSIPGAK